MLLLEREAERERQRETERDRQRREKKRWGWSSVLVLMTDIKLLEASDCLQKQSSLMVNNIEGYK